MEEQRSFTLEEVQQCDGQDGRPTYIVHRERVIDVSNSKLWKGGLHMRRHHAGADLTTDIQAAPHGLEVLERYPQVGVLKTPGDSFTRTIPAALERILTRIPMLRRHPHPMTVHFPIVFLLSTTVFNLIYLITGMPAFEVTALHCLGASVLLTPVAIGTGLYTWWLNYLAKPLRPVYLKKRLSPLLWLLSVIAFVWRLAVPDVAQGFRPMSAVYWLLILAFAPLVTAIGWFGAQMTFPVEKD